jgi:hypothetical protein
VLVVSNNEGYFLKALNWGVFHFPEQELKPLVEEFEKQIMVLNAVLTKGEFL